jgi:hypothetical protein
LGGN